MIITRTPYRLSFFGGGTDYNPWFEEHGGVVLAVGLAHYCYLTVRHLPLSLPITPAASSTARLSRSTIMQRFSTPLLEDAYNFCRFKKGSKFIMMGTCRLVLESVRVPPSRWVCSMRCTLCNNGW